MHDTQADYGEWPTPERFLGFAFWGSKTLLGAIKIGLSTELAKNRFNTQALGV